MQKALIVVVLALAVAGVATAGTGRGLALGSSHLVVHDVFGLQTLELQNFSFAAVNTHDGAATGLFHYRELDDGAPFAADGHVICMTVIGRDAWVGAVIDSSNDPSQVGQGGWWHVTDSGSGSGPAVPHDITTFLGIGTVQATLDFCAAHPAYKHPFPIDGGEILVRG
jgi:hypothetical protein